MNADNRMRVEQGLRALMQADEGAFVVVEHAASGKFVQCMGSREEPLVLDLPRQTLSPADYERAKRLFDSLDGASESDVGFTVECGRDVDRAAEIVMRVFREIYDLAADAPVVVSAVRQ